MHKAIRTTDDRRFVASALSGGAEQQRNAPAGQGAGQDQRLKLSRRTAEGVQGLHGQVLQVPHHRAAHQHHDDQADEWSRYVKRMMHKPNSGISDGQGKTIFEFLAYDQENRKDKNPSAFFKSLSDEEIEKLKAQQH